MHETKSSLKYQWYTSKPWNNKGKNKSYKRHWNKLDISRIDEYVIKYLLFICLYKYWKYFYHMNYLNLKYLFQFEVIQFIFTIYFYPNTKHLIWDVSASKNCNRSSKTSGVGVWGVRCILKEELVVMLKKTWSINAFCLRVYLDWRLYTRPIP